MAYLITVPTAPFFVVVITREVKDRLKSSASSASKRATPTTVGSDKSDITQPPILTKIR